MSSQDKIKKGQRKSSFCGHFMADWDNHHFCPKCRDDAKGDDLCVVASSTECLVCAGFSEEQRKKIKNRNRYKSKKEQNSEAKDVTIDDSLLDEDDSSVSGASQRPFLQKGKSLEEKLDRFFTEFENMSQRLRNLEGKETATVSSRDISDRDSLQVAKQPVANSKSQPVLASTSGCLERRSATTTRAEAEQQSGSGVRSEDFGFGLSRKRSLSQSSEEPDLELEQGELRNRDEDTPGYADTLETIKKWLDLQVSEVDSLFPPSVFSGRDQVKKSVQQSMALPPAQPLVDLWKFKEFSALGSADVDDNDPHHPPMSKGQFLNFPKPQMKFYQVSPQSFSLTAPRLQDAFKNIATPPYQTPTAVSAPMKHYLAWETVSRENIQILNHVFWFKSAIEKATNEMFTEVEKLKDSVVQEDIQQSMNFIQNCLHLQSTTMGCLGKALDDVLDTSMTLASNLLLNRRDNFLKLCHRDVTDKDIAKLRNASLTKKELFNSKVLSEVEQNFIQWSQINWEPVYKKQRSDNYGSRYSDSKKDSSQSRYHNAAFQSFRPQAKQGDQNKRQSNSYNSNRGSARGGRGRRK